MTLVIPKSKTKTILSNLAEDKEYAGKIIVTNKFNASDYCEISVTLTVSKVKVFTFLDFYEFLIFRFSFFEKILNQIFL